MSFAFIFLAIASVVWCITTCSSTCGPSIGEVSEKMIHLSWSPTSDCDGQPNVSYTVTYHGRAHCGYETPHNTTAAFQGTEYTFEGLEEYTNYTFNLTMYPGGMSVVTHAQTLPAAPTGKPQMLTAKNVTDTTVELTWGREDCRGRNGKITGYVVQYNEDSGSDDVYIVLIEGESSQSCTTDSLSPSTSYMFQVAAVNANGTGPLSDPYYVTTLAEENECSHNGGGGSSTPVLAITSAVTVTTVLVSGGLIVIICYQKSQIRRLRKQLPPSKQQSKQNTYLEEEGVDSTANPAYGKLEYQQQDSHLYDRVN